MIKKYFSDFFKRIIFRSKESLKNFYDNREKHADLFFDMLVTFIKVFILMLLLNKFIKNGIISLDIVKVLIVKVNVDIEVIETLLNYNPILTAAFISFERHIFKKKNKKDEDK